jgi:thiamine pyrophosphokinase
MGCTVAIVCNGQFPRLKRPLELLSSADHIICCDGALSILLRKGFVPEAVIGDMDSVSMRDLEQFHGEVVYCPDQETNDQTKALDYVLKTWPDASDIWILGATGKSEAHTIGNLSLLMEYEKKFDFYGHGTSVKIVSDYCEAFAVFSRFIRFPVTPGQKVSIFSPDNTLQMSSQGLYWHTDQVIFDNWWKATLNRASSDVVTLTLNQPAPVLILLDPVK